MSVTNPHPWSDDDGTGTTGTPLNNAVLQIIYNDLGPESSITTSTGTQTALAIPAGVGNLTIFLNNASLLSIKGIQAAAIDGQLLSLISVGAGQVDIYHQDVNATASARLINFATSAPTSLAAGTGIVLLQYDATNGRWRLVQHEQGAWITPTFAAGNYTGNGTQTWTLASGDVTTNKYWLRGRVLTWVLSLNTTSVGGGANTQLRATIPGGLTSGAVGRAYFPTRISDNGAAVVTSLAYSQPNVTYVEFYVAVAGAGNWAAAADTTTVEATMTIEVQ